MLLVCWKRHTPLVRKIWVREIFSLFYIISIQRSYIHQKLDTNSCFAKLRANSYLFSFFYTPCIINRTLHGGLKIWLLSSRVKNNILLLVKYCFHHSKIKVISSHRRVISSIQGVSKKVRQFWNCSQFYNSVHEM
jgi:hypothetical protein